MANCNEKWKHFSEEISWRKCFFIELKNLKLSLSRPLISRVIFFVFILILILYRKHFYCFYAFVNCYLTWPFTSPKYVQLDLLNLSFHHKGIEEKMPRRLHHILLGPLSLNPPLNWLKARNSCLEFHSNYEKHFFWTDQNGEEFLAENYRWFLKTWNSYSTNVQKADALRYFVLYHYGGIFLDMDLSCRHSLDGLLAFLDQQIHFNHLQDLFFAVKAFPVGISNGFLISTPRHPLLKHAIDNLDLFNRNFLLPHATIVISTGPMYLSIQIQLNRSIWNSILVLDGKENMLGGKTDTPLFTHLGSGSWHQADETIFKNIPINIQHQSQTFSISIILTIFFFLLLLLIRNKHFIKTFIQRTLSI